MCNGLCSVCSKQSSSLTDFGGGILTCDDPTVCDNSMSIRKVSEWLLTTDPQHLLNWSLSRKDIFGNTVAEVYRGGIITLFSTIDNGNGVKLVRIFNSVETNDAKDAYTLMKQNKMNALEWCEDKLKEKGYIL